MAHQPHLCGVSRAGFSLYISNFEIAEVALNCDIYRELATNKLPFTKYPSCMVRTQCNRLSTCSRCVAAVQARFEGITLCNSLFIGSFMSNIHT